MLFDDRQVRSVEELLEAIESHSRRAARTPIWLRGSINRQHTVVPTLGRPPFNIEFERALIKAFEMIR